MGRTPATRRTVDYDLTAPTVTVTEVPDTSDGPFTATFTFSEPVTGFTLADIAVGNGAASDLTGGDGDTAFTATITPAADGEVTVDVAADVAEDAAGNGNAAARRASTSADLTAPTVLSVERHDPAGSPTNADSLTWRVTFSEDVANVDPADFTAAGTTATLAVAEATASSVFDVTASGGDLAELNGTVTLGLASGQDVADETGNALADTAPTGADERGWVVDNAAPTVSIAAPDAANAPFTATFTFSEPVTGFAVEDITVGNGTASDLTGGDGATTYTARITPGAEGEVTLDVAADVAADAAGNGNVAAEQVSVTHDMTRPTVTVDAPGAANAPFTATFTFSGPVTGFTVGDIAVGNGTASAFTDTDGGTTYTATITPAAEGEVTLDVAADVAADAAANGNLAATRETVDYDLTAPTVTIAAPSETNAPFTATFTFSEPVTGFAVGDITVGNGAASDFTGGDGDTAFTATITPAADGEVTLDVAADVAEDAAGNGNAAARRASTSADLTAPTVLSVERHDPAGSPTNADSLTWRVTFSEDVANVDQSDFTAAGTTATLAVAEATASTVFDVTASGGDLAGLNGTVTLGLGGGQDVADEAGNALADTAPTGADQRGWVVDNAAPTVEITAPAAANAPFTATFTFSEPVTGFTLADITVGNGTASDLTGGDGATTYTATITPAAEGAVTLDVAADVAEDAAGNGNMAADAAGNGNMAAEQVSVIHDMTRPTVTVDAPGAANAPFTATFTFSEPVTGFTLADITVGNGTASDLTGGDGATTYTATITSAAEGAVTLDVAEDAAEDAAGNGNLAAARRTVDYDLTAPTVTIEAPATANAPFTATFTFSEPVTGFTLADITVGNGATSDFTGGDGDTAFTATITPAADGEVTLDVAADVAEDAAGNGNAAARRASTSADLTAPTVLSVERHDPAGSPTNADSLTWRVTFSEDVANVDPADFTAAGTTATLAVAEATASTVFDVTASGGDLVELNGTVTLGLGGGQDIADEAGNALADTAPTGADQRGWVVDNAAPTVEITVPETSDAPFPATFTFSEPVTGFTLADIAVGNGTASYLTGGDGGTTYTATITPAAEGAVTLDVAADVAEDAAGNGNLAATRRTVDYDLTAPTVTIAAPGAANAPFTATFTFSEPVTGFTLADIAVGNGTASDFTGGDGDTAFTATITPAADGEVTLDVAADVAEDAAGNGNAAARRASTSADLTAPTVLSIVRHDPAGSPTNADSLTWRVTFSEDVANVDPTDFTVAGTTATLAVAEATASSVFDVTASGGDLAGLNGTVTLGLGGGQDVADETGNALADTAPTGADERGWVVDNAVPTVEITVPETSDAPFPATFTFSEPVTGFTLADIAVGNGTASAFTDTDGGTTYTATITPVAEGEVTVDVAADVAADAADNGNLAATRETVDYDVTAPTVTVEAPSETNAPFTATFTFSEPVTGFAVGDITVGNGTASAFTGGDGGTTYTATITPVAEGEVTLDVAADVAEDAAANGNLAATRETVDYDLTAPTVTIAAPSETNAPFTATFTFSEAVTGFAVGDITVGNGAASDFTGGDGDTAFTATITPAADGEVTVDVAADVAEDAAGNGNAAARRASTSADLTAPTVLSVERHDPAGSPTNADSLTWRVTFSEDVANVDPADFTAAGTTATLAVAEATASTVFDVTASGGDLAELNGTVTLGLGGGQDVADEAGNALADTAPSGADQRGWVVDNAAPTVEITAPAAANAPFTATFTFSEPVTGFTLADITVGNGTASDLTGGDGATTYTATITPGAEGAVTLDVAADVAEDAAANGNVAAEQVSVTHDMTRPTVAITAPDAANAPFTATFTFSGPVTGFTVGDIAVGNGTASAFTDTDGGTTYTATITPVAEGEVTLDVAADVAADAAANGNLAATRETVDYDLTAPTVTIAAPDAANAPFTATFTFSEPVTGFAVGDITVGNGAASDFTGGDGDTAFTATITPAADGEVTLDVAADVAEDAAGNGNAAARRASTSADLTAPTVLSVERHDPAGSPTNADSLTWRVTFSEDVANVDQSDFTAAGTTATLAVAEATASTVFDVTASGGDLAGLDGTVTLGLGGGQDVADETGNALADTAPTGADERGWVVDNAAPTVEITAPAAANAPFTATFTFSEPVTGFTLADITVGNGTASDLTGGDGATTYTATITPAAEGAVTLDVAADVAEDAAANGNVAAEQVSVTHDMTRPTVAITAPDAANAPFTATFTFSGPVTGFALADIAVGNGTASAFTDTDGGTTYTATITPAAEGEVTLDVAADVAADAADNGNLAATRETVDYDLTAPTVTVAAPATANAPFTATFTFSEPVTGFAVGDITVGNGAASAFTGGDGGTTYTATITPVAEGEVTLDVAADVAEDAAANGNLAATRETVDYDVTAADAIGPTVASIERHAPAASPTNADALTWRVTFSEDVANVDPADFTVSGTTATLAVTEATASTVYDVTASGGDLAGLDGTVTLGFAAAQNIADTATPPNALTVTAPTGADERGWVLDNTAPALVSAVVGGTMLVLTYDEALDAGSAPAASDYSVSVDGAAAAPSAVAVTGSRVELTLGAAPAADAAVTVTYTVPATNPVRDLVGNQAAALSARSVDRTLIRLAGGAGDHEGRVEVFHSGAWGTVCDDYWDNRDADVACRMAGYEAGSVENAGQFLRAHFGEGPLEKIWLDDLQCRGGEESLFDCPRARNLAVGEHNCGARENVGVRCLVTGETAPPRVTGVTLNDRPGDAWNAGETVEVTLVWSEDVTVATPARGEPPKLWIGFSDDAHPHDSGMMRHAEYASGSGTKLTVFSYTLQAGDYESVQVYRDSLRLRDGTIVSASGVPAELGHRGHPEAMSQLEAPRVAAAPAISGAGPDGAWTPGETVEVGIAFDRQVLVTTTGGTPSIEIGFLNGQKRRAACTFGSRTHELIFAYTLTEEDGAQNAILVTRDSLALGGGLIRGWPDLAPAALGHEGGAKQAGPARVAPPDVAPAGPTGSFSGAPAEHDGRSAFTLGFTMSEAPKAPFSFKTVRDHLFEVTGARLQKAKRAAPGEDRAWNLTFFPGGTGAVTVRMRETRSCDASPRVCTEDGRPLAGELTATIPGPARVSVADAGAREGPGEALDFVVTLSRTRTEASTVRYATAGVTATAGEDYRETSGTLTFDAGVTERTVSVPVRDDSHDEGTETLTLTLSDPSPSGYVRLGDAEATGRISNHDHMPRAWMARFGRTVAEQVLDAVQSRMRASRAPGAELTLAGQRIGLGGAPGSEGGGPSAPGDPVAGLAAGSELGAVAEAEAEAEDNVESEAEKNGERWLAEWLEGEAEPEARVSWRRGVSDRELLLGSSFGLTVSAEGGPPGGLGGTVSLWGRSGVSRFDGREGDLSLDGEVVSSLLGGDWALGSGDATVGLIVGHSRGEGGYRGGSGDGTAGGGTVTSTLTGLYPWGRRALSDRLEVWGAAGYGAGTLTLTPEGPGGEGRAAMRTDLALAMVAAGLRGVALAAPPGGGPELAVTADATGVRTTTARARGLAAAEGDVTRLRLGLEGSRAVRFENGAALTPSVAVGVRHDGGDAETGYGADIGGGVAWSDPGRGLSAELRARGLLSHESEGFRERGLSGTLAWEPEAGGRGPRLSLTRTMGGASSGGVDALFGRRTLAGLAADDDDDPGNHRLEARFGYGFPALGDRFTWTPEAGLSLWDTGRDYTLGWRLVRRSAGWAGSPGSLELSFEASRHEGAGDDSPRHGAGLRLDVRW